MLARLEARQRSLGNRVVPAARRHRSSAGEMAPVMSSDRSLESPQPSLDPLFRLLSADLERVNALILALSLIHI